MSDFTKQLIKNSGSNLGFDLIEGGGVIPTSWILAFGVWDDTGIWIDTEFWID